jgi:hypothetical protein
VEEALHKHFSSNNNRVEPFHSGGVFSELGTDIDNIKTERECTEEQKMRSPERQRAKGQSAEKNWFAWMTWFQEWDIKGGHQSLFGAIDTTQKTKQEKLNNMQDKRKKKIGALMNSRHLCRLIAVRIAALTAVIVGLSVPSAFGITTTQAKAVAVKGDVKSGPPAAPALPQVQQGGNIHVGHAIKTAEVSELLMSPFQGSAVRVLEKSSVILQEVDLQKSGERVIGRKAVLELKKGPMQVIVDPKMKADFKINTPQCVAAARG